MNVQPVSVGLLTLPLYIPPPSPSGRVARERAVDQRRAATGVVEHPAAVVVAVQWSCFLVERAVLKRRAAAVVVDIPPP